MKIRVVMENSVALQARLPLCGQHGLSLLVEQGSQCLLFDVGQSALTIQNINLMGIQLANLTGVVLSHGHYDHTGGLEPVLRHVRRKLPIYVGSGVFADRYSVASGNAAFIGISCCKEQLTSLGGQFTCVSQPLQLEENLWLSGIIPRQTKFEQGDKNLITAEGQDMFGDELALYYLSSNGLVVITGCAHNGIINIIRHGMQVTKTQKVAAIIGGTHLGPVSSEQQEKTIAELAELQPNLIAANHCTGFAMMSRLACQFRERFVNAAAGTEINV